MADWHPEDVKAAIRKQGLTLAELARLHGLGRHAIPCMFHRPWPRVQAIVAQRLGLHPMVIWPSRYDAEGRPLGGLRSRPVANTAPANLPRQRQFGARA